MKNEITTMNKNSAEQRRTNDAETVEKAMEHKMLKPLTGALKDEKTVLGALEQIVSRCCDGVQSYDREITGCVRNPAPRPSTLRYGLWSKSPADEPAYKARF